jgi:hypothetical protein
MFSQLLVSLLLQASFVLLAFMLLLSSLLLLAFLLLLWVLAIASVLVDPVVPILAGVFTYCTVNVQ